jgi:hypothetical protein
MDDLALSGVMNIAGGGSAILAIEPERIYYAIEEGLSWEYLKGYRDAVNHLYEQSKTCGGSDSVVVVSHLAYLD